MRESSKLQNLFVIHSVALPFLAAQPEALCIVRWLPTHEQAAPRVRCVRKLDARDAMDVGFEDQHGGCVHRSWLERQLLHVFTGAQTRPFLVAQSGHAGSLLRVQQFLDKQFSDLVVTDRLAQAVEKQPA